MENIVAINFANNIWKNAQKLNSASALSKGKADRVIEYSDDVFSDAIFKELIADHRAEDFINPNTRGCGYWAWKPYIIFKTLKEMNNGDYLIYSDSGCVFINRISYLIDSMENDSLSVMSFTLNKTKNEREFTKRDAYIIMDCDKSEIVDTPQRTASYILVKNEEETRELIKEYLEYSFDRRIITDEPNVMGLPNYPGFITGRHDQTIWSLLCKKHNIPAYRDPSQYGLIKLKKQPSDVFARSPYPQIIFHHRKKQIKKQWQVALVQYISNMRNSYIK